MARTASNMIALGTEAPDFNLVDVITSNRYSLENIRGKKGTLIMFISNHCPFVKHVNEEIVRLAGDYRVGSWTIPGPEMEFRLTGGIYVMRWMPCFRIKQFQRIRNPVWAVI